MKVRVRGGKSVTLGKRQFVAQGGQASVYAHKGQAYKIYHDAKDMLPEGKIRELAALIDPRVIRPDAVLCDAAGRPIGYTMRHIKDAFALCQLFPRAFRQRHRMAASTTLHLVQQLRESTAAVHRANILLVDGNEMNFLVSKNFKDLFFVDVDSYQTPSYPAQVLMDSIRDRHSRPGVFSEATDWFAFAIVAFQMFAGIHPYKGKHPRCKGIDERMKANISVFDPEVRVPQAAYDLATIPSGYRAWFQATFEDGLRQAPPTTTSSGQVIVCKQTPVKSSARLRFDELASFDAPVLSCFHQEHQLLVATARELWRDRRKLGVIPEGFVGVAFAGPERPVAVSLKESQLGLWDLERKDSVEFGLKVTNAVTVKGRIYAQVATQVLEVHMNRAGTRLVATTQPVVQILEHATQLFDGLVLQNLLGTTFASLLPGGGLSYQVALRELDGAEVLDARLDGTVLMASVRHEGALHRYVFRFSADYANYDCRKVSDVDVSALNFAVLDTGVCVAVAEDDCLEIFRSAKDSTQLETIGDTSGRSDMTLVGRGAELLVLQGEQLFRMSMR